MTVFTKFYFFFFNIPDIFTSKHHLLSMLCFSLFFFQLSQQRDLVRAWPEQSKYCSTHAEGVSVCADLPVIKQAAGGNSANHHDLQHQVLSGQAAQWAEVCRRAPVCVCVRAYMHTFLSLLMITSQVAMQKILRVPEKYSLLPNWGIKKQNDNPSSLPHEPRERIKLVPVV